MSAVNIRTVNLSLPIQNGDRPRPTLFPGHCPTSGHRLGLAVRNCQAELCQISHTNSVAFAVAGFVGQENVGSRTIAILHTTCRLTMRLISAHISQWDVNFAGKWDSALKGNSALRAHVARAAGIELAHRGSICNPLCLGHAKNYDSIKAHLLIPQLVVRGYPIETLALGTFTHKSPRCLQVGNGLSDVVTGCASGILAGCLHSCSWARGLLFELVQSSGYVIPGSVCEEHIDDLSQFATSSSLTQLLRDAAQIGRKLKDGTARLGLTLSCKSTFLANDKSLEKLIVGHIAAEGVPICREKAATVLGIETAAGKRRCASNRWKRIWKGRRRAKRVNRLCKMNPCCAKA